MATSMLHDEPVAALSTRELIGEIMGRGTLLLRKEAELARAEIAADLKSHLAMAKGLAIAAVCGLLGLNALVMALVFGLTAWIPGWLAALVVAGVLLVLAALIGYIGWSRRVMPLTVTRKMLKEDVRWAKQQLT